ncbi:HAMP domain-containing sensor histidine kinase [Photobacterium sp. OFAV2-7]|uniref:sensor histidine kinase n=1 Tax=Photobacterium sp. OFAV2-7 TaxID=2917748 RepID=UPI001EF66DB4|nr:HAMP domain-containing sensor histidine kinase [Photobacterium sp. OFAV2-7]MCG7585758.1 HAMP domain-containing histidine kinase [Photobacterium sp. OFAV2-7]
MMFLRKFSVSSKLTSYFFGIALLTVLVYTELLVQFFENGIESSAELRLLTETHSFSNAYQKDKTAPLPSSYMMKFYFDELPKLIIEQSDILKDVNIDVGDFLFIMGDEVVPKLLKDEFVLVLHHAKLYDGRSLYAIAKYDFNLLAEHETERWDEDFLFILYIGVGYLVLILIALWFYSYRVGKKSAALVDWAEQISTEKLDSERPDFRFDEYNRVATCLEQSLKRNAALMKREKKFLSHASHELRTPIAIIRANMEILERMDIPESALGSLSRVERANTNMQLITETLLWLGRKNDTAPAEYQVNLPHLLKQLIDDHTYLIQGESVEVIHDYDTAPDEILPATPLMIVLNNLIRNAFQYTHKGWIKVTYQSGTIIVENYDMDLVNDREVVSFGLGLELTQKVCSRLNWNLDINYSDGGVKAVLQLPVS